MPDKLEYPEFQNALNAVLVTAAEKPTEKVIEDLEFFFRENDPDIETHLDITKDVMRVMGYLDFRVDVLLANLPDILIKKEGFEKWDLVVHEMQDFYNKESIDSLTENWHGFLHAYMEGRAIRQFNFSPELLSFENPIGSKQFQKVLSESIYSDSWLAPKTKFVFQSWYEQQEKSNAFLVAYLVSVSSNTLMDEWTLQEKEEHHKYVANRLVTNGIYELKKHIENSIENSKKRGTEFLSTLISLPENVVTKGTHSLSNEQKQTLQCMLLGIAEQNEANTLPEFCNTSKTFKKNLLRYVEDNIVNRKIKIIALQQLEKNSNSPLDKALNNDNTVSSFVYFLSSRSGLADKAKQIEKIVIAETMNAIKSGRQMHAVALGNNKNASNAYEKAVNLHESEKGAKLPSNTGGESLGRNGSSLWSESQSGKSNKGVSPTGFSLINPNDTDSIHLHL